MTQHALVLTPAQRKTLKALAHSLNPVVMIGDKGLTPAVIKEIDQSLEAHQLIKVRVLGDDREMRLALIEEITEHTLASPVQHIGKLLVFYRHNPNKQNLLPSGKAAATKAKPGSDAKTAERPRRSASSPTKGRATSEQQTPRSRPRADARTESSERPARPRRRSA